MSTLLSPKVTFEDAKKGSRCSVRLMGRTFKGRGDTHADALANAARAWQEWLSGRGMPDWEGFARAVMEAWPSGDVDGFDLQYLADRYHIIKIVEGGFDPSVHVDECGVGFDPGDEFFERNYSREGEG